MDFTPEQLARAKAANSAGELLAYANEVGYKLTEEEAKCFFDEWHRNGELSDDELDNVSGGCGGPDISSDDPRCPKCGTSLIYDRGGCTITSEGSHEYDRFRCPSCNMFYRRFWEGDQWVEDRDQF